MCMGNEKPQKLTRAPENRTRGSYDCEADVLGLPEDGRRHPYPAEIPKRNFQGDDKTRIMLLKTFFP